MDEQVKKFIEDNINLIEDDTKESWEEIYENACLKNEEHLKGKFTEVLLQAHINPLYKMNYIPNYFLSDSNIEYFEIPPNIIKIEYWAFSNCKNLSKIIWPTSVKELGSSIFASCNKLKEITFLGTKKEWRKIPKIRNISWRGYSYIKKIICTDGEIEL